MGDVACYALVTGTEEYTFLPPRDWRAKVAPAQDQLTLQSSNYEASITLDVVTPRSLRGSNSNPVSFRQAVLMQFTNATILEEFPCYTGASPGQGFDVEWLAFDKYRMGARVAFVPISGGTLKFVLSAKTLALPAYQPVFARVLTSFHQTSAGGSEDGRQENEKTGKRVVGVPFSSLRD